MKTCTKCNEVKPEDSFAQKTKTTRHTHCKQCQRVINQEHYCENKRKISDKAKSAYWKARNFVTSLKQDKSCVDCNVRYNFWQMDYDHLTSKVLSVSVMVGRGYSQEAILAEIAKCDLVCANCHRDRTYKRALRKKMDSSLTTATSGPS